MKAGAQLGAPRPRGRTALRRFLPAVLLGLPLWGCGEDAGAPAEPPSDLPTLSLRLRIHVLSSTVATLDATTSDARLREVLQRVNRIWSQAGIAWELDGIVREATADDREFAGALDRGGPLDDPGRILAHELGHSLTLPHVSCTPAGNLMSPGCAGSDRARLTAGQIERARAQAATGRPAR